MRILNQTAEILAGILIVTALLGTVQWPMLQKADAYHVACHGGGNHCYTLLRYGTVSGGPILRDGAHGDILLYDATLATTDTFITRPLWIVFPTNGWWVEVGAWKGNMFCGVANGAPRFYVFWRNNTSPYNYCYTFGNASFAWHTFQIWDQNSDERYEVWIDGTLRTTSPDMVDSTGRLDVGAESEHYQNEILGHWDDIFWFSGGNEARWASKICVIDPAYPNNHYYIDEVEPNDDSDFWFYTGSSAGDCQSD